MRLLKIISWICIIAFATGGSGQTPDPHETQPERPQPRAIYAGMTYNIGQIAK